MESIMIIVVGLIFSVLSKSVKNKKEVEKEKQKRKQQLKGTDHNNLESYDVERKTETKNNKSLRDVFMEELNKLDGEDEKGEKVEQVQTSYQNQDSYVSEQEYLDQKGYRDIRDPISESYMNGSSTKENIETMEKEIVDKVRKKSKDTAKSKSKRNKRDNRQYNPFSNSMNRKDIIRGIIFSEVLDKPKSQRK